MNTLSLIAIAFLGTAVWLAALELRVRILERAPQRRPAPTARIDDNGEVKG